MLTPLCVTYSVGFPNFSQPAALPPLALRAALACVLVTQIFFAPSAWVFKASCPRTSIVEFLGSWSLSFVVLHVGIANRKRCCD